MADPVPMFYTQEHANTALSHHPASDAHSLPCSTLSAGAEPTYFPKYCRDKINATTLGVECK